jgi:hypothetical protein
MFFCAFYTSMNGDVTPTNAQYLFNTTYYRKLPTCFGQNRPSSGQYFTQKYRELQFIIPTI